MGLTPSPASSWMEEEVDPEIEAFSTTLWELSKEDIKFRSTFRTFSHMSESAKQRFIRHTTLMAEKGMPLHEEILRRIVARKLTDV